MNLDAFFLNSILLLVLALISFFLVQALIKFLREKKKLEHKDVSKVGFVVDTFHDLVSKLKDKEKELEELRKQAEDKATAIEGYNENILQSVPSGVISFGEDMRITKVNQSAEKILEIKGKSIIGKHYSEVLSKPITDLLNGKKIIERGEIRYVTQSGKSIWLGFTLSPLKDSKDQTIGQILVFTDLTHLRAIESQMQLRDKLSSLGEISAGIAHELRNPLGVISGYTKILSRKADKNLKPAIDAISKEIVVMDRIISDFHSFTKPSELNISEFDLKKTIANCLSSTIGERQNILLKVDMHELPLIRGDEILLRQAFTNLIQNAVESMPRGGELTIGASKGEFLEISISDSGHGISENIRDKIFLPFFTTKEKGTGLGLAIVHKTVMLHGGDITLESSEKGTTFKIRFPLEMVST